MHLGLGLWWKLSQVWALAALNLSVLGLWQTCRSSVWVKWWGRSCPWDPFAAGEFELNAWGVMLYPRLPRGPLNLLCKAIRYTWNYCMLFNYKICLKVCVSLSLWAVCTITGDPATVSGLITVHHTVQHSWARAREIYRLPGDNHFKKKDQWYASHWKEQQVPISALLEDIKHLHKLFKGRNDR